VNDDYKSAALPVAIFLVF